MNQNTHYGSYQVTRKASSSKTTTQKQMKAKNPANQAALDKLAEVRQKRQEKNPNSNYIITIKRAMNSLRACNTPITSQKEACQLKNIGPAFAKIICPHQLFSPTATDPPPPFVKAGTKRQRQSMLTSSPDTTAARTKIEQGPTNKQNVYEKEKSIAESLDLKTCGPWRVILLVDNREHKSQHVVSKCKQSGIPCEERTLPIGDMTWIAQCTKTGKEILCGTIMERKESSDLVSSLFGTRYLEQRLRMQHCGLPQLLYLVEGNIASNGNCPAETLQMAMMETRVLGFNVIQTAHLQGTVKQLKGLHRRIVQRTFPEAFSSELPTFAASPTESIGNRRRRRPTSLLEMKFDTSPKPPLSQERFMTYHELKAKVEMDREAGTRTIGAVYMAMLKQVPSLSHKKCEAIARVYPTINSLMTAFATTDSPQTMIRDIPMDRQKVGPKSANELFVACCTRRNGSLPRSSSESKATSTAVATATASRKQAPVTTSTSPLSVAAKMPSSPSSPTPNNHRNSTISDACVDLTQDTPQKPSARALPVATFASRRPSRTSFSQSSSGSGIFTSPNDFSLPAAKAPSKKTLNNKENNPNYASVLNRSQHNVTRRTKETDLSSPLFSSPDSSSSLGTGGGRIAIDWTNAIATKNQDQSICVIDDSSDEDGAISTKAAPKKEGTQFTNVRTVSNSSSMAGFSPSSTEEDDDVLAIRNDLRSRLAKRRKVETIEID